MGGSTVRYEPKNLDALLLHPDVYQIFLQAGWIPYFKKLQRFNEAEVLEFSQNLTEGYSIVNGVRIPVTEESVAVVTGLPITGNRWFSRKAHLPKAEQDFLVNDERVQTKGRGVDVNSLPAPWGKVTEFIKRYITCEGRYQVVYFSDFIILSHLRHQKLINMPYYILQSLHNMAQFVKRSKHPMNCLSNHRLIGLLIHRGMGLPHDPLPEVPVPSTVPAAIANPEQPISAPAVTANLDQSTVAPAVTADPEQSTPVSSTAPAVKTSTVIPRKSTLNTKRKIRSTSHTAQKHLDSIQPTQLNPIHTDVIEPHEPQSLAATEVVTELAPTPKAKKRETLTPISTLPRKRTRSEKLIATEVQAPIVTDSMTTTSTVEPTITQNPSIAATVVQTPTVNATELPQKIKRRSRRKSQKDIDRVVATECPNLVDTQTLPDFDINDTNLSERLTDFMEVRIPGFTLCKEFQDTISSLQAECQRVAPESSALLDDYVHHSSGDEVQILPDPSIPEFPPCMVVEELPPSSSLIIEEHPPSPEPKRRSSVFISTLPKRRTRSARLAEAAVGWTNIEKAVPILRPLSSVVQNEVVTQEPTSSEISCHTRT
jgi:hypothetical protein